MLLLYLIFFLSGATGLVYEVVWVRLTGLVFGNTSHAIAVVLSAFMAGLALGSWALGRKTDQVARPLRFYGMLEIGIGISAALVPFIFRLLDKLYMALAPSVEGVPAADISVRFLTSFVILLVPTFMMGGTLPALARFFARAIDEVERKVAVLYALNTFGAAAGTLIAALALIPTFGNRLSTLAIGAVNILIGALAIWLDSRVRMQERAPARVPESPAPAVQADRSRDALVLATLAGSGLASMFYEVAWTRALSAMIGSSTYAFSIMLVTFLVGIALGSAIIGRWRPTAGLRLLGFLQFGVAIGGLIFLAGYIVLPYVLVGMLRAMDYSFPAVLASQFLCSAGLMIFATLCMGATLPVASQMVSVRMRALGSTIGGVYSINTVGAIIGSVAAGFLLLPYLGAERTILAGLFVNSALAFALLSHESSRSAFARWGALALLVVATLTMRGGTFWKPSMLDQGILVYSQQFSSRPELTIAEHYQDTEVTYFQEGSNATISVRRGEDYLGLRTNGKVDASNRADMATQLMVGYLPVLYHPQPRSLMIIGYGSGVTVGAAATLEELETIDCIEIERAVFDAAPNFSSINKDSYKNPKVKMTFADARHVMNVTSRQYDVIISEPSNPWVAGVASLFTSDFYERAAQVLKPDGIFAQWVQLYELDPEDLRMILYEVHAKFPEMSAWVTGGDLIIIASRQPQRLNIDRMVALGKDPRVAADLRDYLKMTRPEGLLAYYVTSTGPLAQLAVTDRRNSDDHPTLEFHAPRQLFVQTRDLNAAVLDAARDGLVPPGATSSSWERTYTAMVEPFLDMDRVDLARQAVDKLAQQDRADDTLLSLARARIALATDALLEARLALEKAEKAAGSAGPLAAETQELWGIRSDKEGNGAEAARRYALAAAADPTRPTPLRKLAEAAAAERRWDEAATRMEQYLETNPKNPSLHWAALGEYRLNSLKMEQGLQAIETSLQFDPYSYWAHLRLARLFEDRNMPADAIREYEFLARYAFDRDPEIYLKLASLYRAAGRNDDARSVLKTGLRMFPADVNIYRLYRDLGGV
ncbi:MAG TPA: fused MFS/spermidine synthase [Terriglobia bacterium]|nr:fused MFS/spermidine synthase [Terriglobia bacterium]